MRERETTGELVAASSPDTYQVHGTDKNSLITDDFKCPTCGHPYPFTSLDWIGELPLLLAKHADRLGITPDLAAFTLMEAWGLFQMLTGLAK